MQVEFLKKFYKDLDKISETTVKTDIVQTIENVESAKKISEIKNLKKLSGFKHAYRIKIGDYRIGIFIENNIIEFARVIHRKEIYKKFP